MRTIEHPLVGGGQPLGNLIEQVALDSPDKAVQLVESIPGKDTFQNGIVLVIHGATVRHPGDVPRLARPIPNYAAPSWVLAAAAQSLAAEGRTDEARALAEAVGGAKGPARITLAEVTRDRALLADCLKDASSGGYDSREWERVVPTVVRVVGVKEAERMIEEAAPELPGAWKSPHFYDLLWVMAELDPQWTLDAFRRGPGGVGRSDASLSDYRVDDLLAEMAPLDPDLVAAYIEKNGRAEHPQGLAGILRECMSHIARRSIPDAAAFAKRVAPLTKDFSGASATGLERENVRARIAAAGKDVNKVLAGVPAWLQPVRAELLTGAFTLFPGGVRNVDAVLELAGAVEDKALADEALHNVVAYYGSSEAGALRLAAAIVSPWRRADALCHRAFRELDPRPGEPHSPLGGWALERDTRGL